jgi:uncharacterized protein YrrD
MLWRCGELRGYAIAASDGKIGAIDDLLFDEARWSVRWLVVDTGGWLSGCRVLLPPAALGHPDREARCLPVTLSRAQVEASPPLESDLPVSRQVEADIFAHYGWPPYWESDLGAPLSYLSSGGLGGGFLFPPDLARTAAEPAVAGSKPGAEAARNADPNLRSIRDTTGDLILAKDGTIGHVEDFLLDEADWRIRYMIVDTRNWLPGRKVLVAPQWIADIDWADRRVSVELSREAVRSSPPYDPTAPLGRAEEEALHGHYRRPGYWTGSR